MSLLDQAIIDCAMMTTGPFSSTVTLTATNSQAATIQAIHNKIGKKLDMSSGMVINTKNATVVFAESVILAANQAFPVRNSDNEVSMLGVIVSVPDSTGNVRNYLVKENIPDETVGLITLILGDYSA